MQLKQTCCMRACPGGLRLSIARRVTIPLLLAEMLQSKCRDPRCAVQPTDARLTVFESASEATRVWIKGRRFSLSTLCSNLWSCEQLEGCSLVLSRHARLPLVK